MFLIFEQTEMERIRDATCTSLQQLQTPLDQNSDRFDTTWTYDLLDKND